MREKDYLNRPLEIKQILDGYQYVVGYEYLDEEKKIKVIYPGGIAVEKSYDELNRLTKVHTQGMDLVNYIYEGALMQSKTLGNGVTATYGYNTAGRLGSMDYTGIQGVNVTFDWKRNAVGNISSIKRGHLPNLSEKYSYDNGYQLTQFLQGTLTETEEIINPSQDQQWDLDNRGNWDTYTKNGQVQSRTHNGVNEITGITNQTVVWDDNGNLSQYQGVNLEWDSQNKLKAHGNNHYEYDALGRRVKKTLANGTVKHYIYDGWQVIMEKSSTGETKYYAYGAYIDEPIVLARDQGAGLELYYYIQGSNYNIEALTDNSGNIKEFNKITPYGTFTRYNISGQDITVSGSLVGNEYLFQGRRYDAESGLYYFRNRYYSSDLGRFVSRDPMGYVDGVSLYQAYMVPNGLDPMGLVKIEIWASAFIKPREITFPYFGGKSEFDGSLSLEADPNAKWHGDGRDFGVKQSARGYHFIMLEVNSEGSNIVQNTSGSGTTTVTSIFGTQSATAPPPALAKISGGKCFARVELTLNSSNPLAFGAPSIDYNYLILIDLKENKITWSGIHDSFPWNELYINKDAMVNDSPSGWTSTPLDLIPINHVNRNGSIPISNEKCCK